MTVSRDDEVPLRRSPARALTALRASALAAVTLGLPGRPTPAPPSAR